MSIEKKIITIIFDEKSCGHEGRRRRKKDIKIIASTEDVDRDGDIIRAKGWDIENYLKNPVILPVHNWKGEPVAKIENIYIEDGKLVAEGIDFAETDEGEKYKYLVENEFIKTVSVGFMPKKIFFLGDENQVEEMKNLDNEWYEKNVEKLTKAKRVIWEAELLEISFVPIPSNPNAIIVMAQKGFETAYIKNENDELVEIDITPYAEIKNPIPPSVHPKNMKLDSQSSWDQSKARESLRKWASKDGSGDKDTIDWVKYRKGFTWYDANSPENFGSYKLPTHWIDNEGNFVLVWRGVTSAMASFMGARGGLNIPADDRRGVYNHLASEYRKFGKEPPPYKERGYTFEEALKVFDPDTLEDYIKLYPEEVIEFAKNKMNEMEKLQKEINDLKNQINDKSVPPCPEDGHVDNSNGTEQNSKKIVLTQDQLIKTVSLAVEQFLKNFKKRR